METIEESPQHRGTLIAVRWALIAVCASLILFSNNMRGRMGLAMLLLLAVFLGRYASRRKARLRGTQQVLQPHGEASAQARTSDLPRREAGH